MSTPKENRRKYTEINEKKIKKRTSVKSTKSWFFQRINKVDKSLARLKCGGWSSISEMK